MGFTTSDPAVARIPNVLIEPGETTGPFALTIADSAADQTVTLTAGADLAVTTTITIPDRQIRTADLGTVADHHAVVLGLACLDGFVYATHFHSKIGNPHQTPGAGELVVLVGDTLEEVPDRASSARLPSPQHCGQPADPTCVRDQRRSARASACRSSTALTPANPPRSMR